MASDPQVLEDVYEDVVDHSASASVTSSGGAVMDRIHIQEAIDTGKHVLFPKGTYKFAGEIRFANANQRCLFLAGAILQAFDETAYVHITSDPSADEVPPPGS